MSRSTGKNFFQAHWDWLVALAGVAALVASIVFNFVLAEPPEEVSFGAMQGKAVEPVDMAAYVFSTNMFENPHQLVEADWEKANFLASGLRVFCSPGDVGKKGCGRPIVFPSEKCPFCGESQKEEEKPTEDHDGDGIPDEWEKANGLDPLLATDADEDKDDDGFTNLEEFQAGTDPKDTKSHPDYLAFFTLDPKLDQKFTTLEFVKVLYKTPSGLKVQFRDPRFAKEIGNGIFPTLIGEEIKSVDPAKKRTITTGFIAKKYEERHQKVKIVGSESKKDVDESFVTVERKSDGKLIDLVVGAPKTPTDMEAKILFDRIASKGVQAFPVVEGREFDVNGSKYKAETIKKQGKGFSVTIVSLATGEKRTIEALEQ